METTTALHTVMIARLINLLKALGISQYAIARRAGVKQPLVSQWARGVRPVPDHHQHLLFTLLQEVWQQHRQSTDIPAIDEAMRSGAVPDIFTWYAQQRPIYDAYEAYTIAAKRLMDVEHPGSGLHDLYLEAETQGAEIADLLALGATTWTFHDRIRLKSAAEQLCNVLTMLDLVEPEEIWTAERQAIIRIMQDPTLGEADVTTREHALREAVQQARAERHPRPQRRRNGGDEQT